MLEFYKFQSNLVVKHMNEWWRATTITEDRIMMQRFYLPAYMSPSKLTKWGWVTCAGRLHNRGLLITLKCYRTRDVIKALTKREFAFVDPLTHRWKINPLAPRPPRHVDCMEILVTLKPINDSQLAIKGDVK